MKNFILAIVLFFAFIALSLPSEAACPSGYTLHTVSGTYSYTSPAGDNFTCSLIIKYCCKWDNTTKTVISEIDEVYSITENCIGYIPNWSHFLNWLHNTVALNSNFDCSPQFPPCDEGVKYEYKTLLPQCLYFENYQPYLGDDYILKLKSCSETYKCIYTFEVCLDYNTNPPTTVRNLVSITSEGTPSCPTTMPTLPSEGSPLWNTYWTTYCFAKSNCN